MDEDATAFAAETEAFLKERLRARFPYMKQTVFDALIINTVQTLQTGVEKNMPEMEATKSRISFLSLSAELRNRIYEEVLEPDNRTHLIEIGSHYGRKDRMKLPAITQVSQQVRGETLPMYYSNKSFHFSATEQERMTMVEEWLKIIGPKQAAMVKDLDVFTNLTKSEWMGDVVAALADRGTPVGSAQEMLRDDEAFRAWGLDQLTKARISILFAEPSGLLQSLRFEDGRAKYIHEEIEDGRAVYICEEIIDGKAVYIRV